MATQKIEHAAAKKQSLTLDQLAAFVQAAMRSGATGTEPVAAVVTFGGKLHKISIEVDSEAVRTAAVEPSTERTESGHA